MKRLLWLLLLIAAPVATSAQNAGTAPASPPGLNFSEPTWEPVSPTFFAGGDIVPGLVGRNSSRAPLAPPNIRSSPAGNSISYRGAHVVSNSGRMSYGGAIWRRAFVQLTNTGTSAIKFIHLDYVFTDPSTGVEVLRIRRRSRKRVNPGKSYVYEKMVKASELNRRGDEAQMSVDVTEVVYADKTVWHKP